MNDYEDTHMASKNNEKIISEASPHTIKKFELIEQYVKSWAQKLMNNKNCNGIIFIDCMCNSGVYTTKDSGTEIFGTPIRVAKILLDVARIHPEKQVEIYFNDLSQAKINELRKHLPGDERNYKIITTEKDGNELLKWIGPQLKASQHKHYFLLYDPYDASIDWEALRPFFNNWGEVLINHMISDTLRAVGQVKKEEKKKKYQNTYQVATLEELIPYGQDKQAYEKRLVEIIDRMRTSSSREYYVAAFPFFNRNNALVYDLVHCTSHEKGFKLFKTTAWKTFGDQSSLKNRHGNEMKLVLDFESGEIVTPVDDSCYNLDDIANFIQKEFSGKNDISWDKVWAIVDQHPLFPSDGYKNELKKRLKDSYDVVIDTKNKTMNFRN